MRCCHTLADGRAVATPILRPRRRESGRRLGVFGARCFLIAQNRLRQTARLRGRSYATEPATRSQTGGLSPHPSTATAARVRTEVGRVWRTVLSHRPKSTPPNRPTLGGNARCGAATRSQTGGLSPHPSYGHGGASPDGGWACLARGAFSSPKIDSAKPPDSGRQRAMRRLHALADGRAVATPILLSGMALECRRESAR